jgi:competence protein ComEC
MIYLKKYFIQFLTFVFLFCGFLIVYVSYIPKDDGYLKVVFFDVGQGDAIYIEAPNGRQMLVDGGRGREILPKLIKTMPVFDRSIDVVIITNPDLDHIGGIVEVLKNYEVGLIIEPGTISDSLTYQRLEEEISENNISRIIAQNGQRLVLDKEENIYFDILFPDRDVSLWERNDGSVVGKLIFDDISFMLMGDATNYTENIISWNYDKKDLVSNILKLGHHGSKTSSSKLWLDFVNPDLAIISAGENNQYGHPHKEVLDRLILLDIPYLSTMDGNLIFKTNGQNLFLLK